MYGAYVEVAAYNRNWDAVEAGGRGPRRSSLHADCLAWMPTGFFEVPVDASATWSSRENCAGCRQDFVLVCEVSEVEGPRPLFTVPEDVDTNHDVNTLAEKMMSVDYHGGTSDPFTLTNDTQIVLSTVVDGLHALVNYFLLYDICARGFVRPMCIAYLTSEKKKLIDYFESMRNKFLEVTRYLKYGNRRLFLQEVELYLDDLLAAKDTYVKRRSSVGENFEDSEDNITINLFANNITEAQLMLASDKPMLADPSAATMFWKVETKLRTQYNRNLYQYVKSFVITEPMHSPKLSPFKGSAMHLEMRSMFELCSWGIVLGLNLLVSLQKFFKRDVVTIYMESEDLRVLGDSDGFPLMIGTHVLADVTDVNVDCRMKSKARCNDSACESNEESLNFERNLLELQSFFSRAASKHETAYYLSSDDNLSYEDAVSETPPPSMNDHDDCYSLMASADIVPCCSGGATSSLVTDLGERKMASSKTKTLLSAGTDVEKNPVVRRCVLQRCHSRCAMATVLCQTTASHVDFLTPDKAGYGIASVFNRLSSFVHILYSLLVGRPVLVLGSAEEQDFVRSVVQAFDLFVPEKDRAGCVIPWCTTGLKAMDISQVSLAGFLLVGHVSENQILSSSLKQKVSFVNVSKKTYQGPLYSGNFLSCLARIRKLGWEDATFITFLHSLLLAYASRVSLYHRFVNISGMSSTEPSGDPALLPQKSKDILLSALSLSKDDAHVVQHLSELLLGKMQNA